MYHASFLAPILQSNNFDRNDVTIECVSYSAYGYENMTYGCQWHDRSGLATPMPSAIILELLPIIIVEKVEVSGSKEKGHFVP